jgi:sporadic carbohydrate cluster protein (TIGR04323 family)|tara:strand:+ start:3543 stop:4625 length:1083 start_codon:yes stop_codon:yes gene_type:complete
MIENFENNTLDYDLKKYPWNEWILETIQQINPRVKDMTTINELITPEEAWKIQEFVQNSFKDVVYQKRFEDFAEEYGSKLLGTTDYLIKRQPTLNLVIPDQVSLKRRLPFHQGIWYNNGTGMRTIWMPITPAYDSNSMYVIDTDESRKITQETIDKKYSLEDFEKVCEQYARPVNLNPGQCHLFHQEHIHGNINNTTGKCRLAIDWHLLPKGEPHGRRMPGGFFKLPGDYGEVQDVPKDGRYVGYVGNNTNFDYKIPQRFQRSIIDEYCAEIGIQTVGYQFENEGLVWMPILEHYLEQKPTGIVMNSIYSLPDDADRRNFILDKALELNVMMIFATEVIVMKTEKDIAKIKKYFEYYRID